MAGSLVKKLAGRNKPKGAGTKNMCLWCAKKKVAAASELPICDTCVSLGREEVTDAPTDTLKQMFRLADIVKDYVQWTTSSSALAGVKQVADLGERARLALISNYPITLTCEAVENRAFQDNLTEAFKLWMRETKQSAKSDMGILTQLMSTFCPTAMKTELVTVGSYPKGTITIKLDMIRKILGVSKKEEDFLDRVTIELPNLFAMLDPNYAGCLACMLEGDPDAVATPRIPN
jgi:hypothetical protein